jgi:alpha-tubulin suppressor-like RCC1 family protein
MSTKNVFRLNKIHDLIVSGQIQYQGAGELWIWGFNAYGQLGDNTNVPKSSPVQIPGTTWSIIADKSNKSSVAIKTDGTLWSWGYNGTGGLGDGTRVHRSSPIQIPGTAWNKVIGAGRHFLATKTDGSLWTWGYGGEGRLGDNTTVSRCSPVQVPGTSWADVAGGGNFSVARKTDGTLWTWGYGCFGMLGNDSTILRSSPVQIPGTSWNDASGGGNHSLARKIDGTLWSWGYNGSGQLGNNTRLGFPNGFSSPVQVPGTNWNDIAAHGRHSSARKTDGTLWTWGSGSQYGQLGDNTTVNKSSPPRYRVPVGVVFLEVPAIHKQERLMEPSGPGEIMLMVN